MVSSGKFSIVSQTQENLKTDEKGEIVMDEPRSARTPCWKLLTPVYLPLRSDEENNIQDRRGHASPNNKCCLHCKLA